MKEHISPEALSAYADGALGEAERRQIETHVSHCIPCGREVAQLQRVRDLLRQRESFPVPPFFAARLAATLKERRERNSIADFVWVAKRLMPGLAVFFAGFLLWASSHTSDKTSQASDAFAVSDSTTAMSILAVNDRELTTDDVLHLAVYEPSDSE